MTCSSRLPLVWTCAAVDGSLITQKDLLSARSTQNVALEMWLIMWSTRAVMLVMPLVTLTANVKLLKNVLYYFCYNEYVDFVKRTLIVKNPFPSDYFVAICYIPVCFLLSSFAPVAMRTKVQTEINTQQHVLHSICLIRLLPLLSLNLSINC